MSRSRCRERLWKRCRARLIRTRRITVIGRGSFPTKLFDGGVEAALKLEIVVRIKNVMFPIVLVLVDYFYFGKASPEQGPVLAGRTIAVKGESAPSAKNVHQVAF